MQCERLIGMIKSWYLHVREETMAPARMVSFMEKHVATCSVCQQDPDINDEISRITEMILPESKIPKAVRQQNAASDDDEDTDDEMDEDTDIDQDDEENEEEDEDEDDLDEEEDDEEDLDLDDIDDD